MSEPVITHAFKLLANSGDAWAEVRIPCGLAQVDVECIDSGADSAGVACLVVYDRDPSNEATGRQAVKPIPADAVHELHAPHIPARLFAKVSASGSTTPLLQLTMYRKVATCGCEGK